MDIAEAFNEYFSSVGDNLAASIPTPDHDPSFYLKATNKTFSLQSPTFETVYELLSEIDEKKSVRLDNIPNKLLKMAAQVVAHSLTGIFSTSIRTGIFPNEWKASRATPQYSKVVLRVIQAITDQFPLFLPLQKFLRKLFLTNYINT